MDNKLGESPDLRGKVVLLEFFGTWSSACLSVIPRLNALQDKYSNQGFTVLAVSREDSSKVKSFLERTRITYPVVVNESLSAKFGIKLIPQAMLIDRNGVVVWEGPPQKLTDDLIEKCLATRVGSR